VKAGSSHGCCDHEIMEFNVYRYLMGAKKKTETDPSSGAQ